MRLERLREAENHERFDCCVKEFAMFPKSNRKLIRVVNRCFLTRSVFWGEKKSLTLQTRDGSGLMCQFCIAAKTNYHKLSNLKQYHSFRGSEVWAQHGLAGFSVYDLRRQKTTCWLGLSFTSQAHGLYRQNSFPSPAFHVAPPIFKPVRKPETLMFPISPASLSAASLLFPLLPSAGRQLCF